MLRSNGHDNSSVKRHAREEGDIKKGKVDKESVNEKGGRLCYTILETIVLKKV